MWSQQYHSGRGIKNRGRLPGRRWIHNASNAGSRTDRILQLYVIDNLTRGEIVAHGFDDATVADVLRRVGRAEYKRRQAPTILKVSPRAFGTGRRYPIAREIHEVS